jgi:hypothetical protein
MSLTFTRWAAGLAVLAALAAGCGSAAATRPAGVQPKPTPSASPSHTTSPATHAAAHHKHVPRAVPPSTTPALPPTMAPAPPTMVPAPAPSMAPASTIPQGDGGDHDADNNGGPSDGDGNV